MPPHKPIFFALLMSVLSLVFIFDFGREMDDAAKKIVNDFSAWVASVSSEYPAHDELDVHALEVTQEF